MVSLCLSVPNLSGQLIGFRTKIQPNCGFLQDMLLSNERFVTVLVDSLLLDSDHPRKAAGTFGSVKSAVQRDAAEALQQLSVYPPGREALLADPTVSEALSEVADCGWSDGEKCSYSLFVPGLLMKRWF